MFESNDTFVEEAVKSAETTKQKTIKFTCLGLTIIFALSLLIGFLPIVSLVLFVGFLIATIILMGNTNIEYEYDYTNGSLEIAKITNNSKRKKIIAIEAEQVRMVAAMGTNEALKYDNVTLKIYDCSAHREDAQDFVLVAHDDKKNEDFKVLFNPSEKLLNAMKHYNKRDIYM